MLIVTSSLTTMHIITFECLIRELSFASNNIPLTPFILQPNFTFHHALFATFSISKLRQIESCYLLILINLGEFPFWFFFAFCLYNSLRLISSTFVDITIMGFSRKECVSISHMQIMAWSYVGSKLVDDKGEGVLCLQ